MNCDDLKPFLDAYLDSELDARTTLEIQEHLAGCRCCAAVFARSAAFERQLGLALRSGETSPEFWAPLEHRVLSADLPDPAPAEAAPRLPRREATSAEPWWRFWLWPSPRAYAALAAVWGLLLALTLGSDGTAGMPGRAIAPAATAATTSAEIKVLLSQQQALRAELLDLCATPTTSDRTIPPQSRLRSVARSTSV